MWFEILPAAGIIFGALYVPGVAMHVIHTVVLGNCYRRDLRWWNDRNMYQRDMRITKNPYHRNGLEVIPPCPCEIIQEEEDKKKCETAQTEEEKKECEERFKNN